MTEKDFLTGLRWSLMDWRRRRIKAARAERGMSQEQLVADCSWGISKHRNIERGKTEPTSGELFEIATALGVDVLYFLREDVEPFPTPAAAPDEDQGGQDQARRPSRSEIAQALPKAKRENLATRRRQAKS